MKVINNLILLIIFFLFFTLSNIFSEESNRKIFSPRGKVAIGLNFPFPIAFEVSTNHFDIGIGMNHFKLNDLFSLNIVGTLYIYYIFLNYRLIEDKDFFLFIGTGMFFDAGNIHIIANNKNYSGFAYKVGIGVPIGFSFQIENANFEFLAKLTPLIFIGQDPSNNFIFPIGGNFSLGFRGWIN